MWNGCSDWGNRGALNCQRVSAQLHGTEVSSVAYVVERLTPEPRNIGKRYVRIACNVLDQSPPPALDLWRHGVHTGVHDPVAHTSDRSAGERLTLEPVTSAKH